MQVLDLKHFCDKLGLTDAEDGFRLIRLSNRAADDQVKEMNEGVNVCDSSKAIERVELFAKAKNIRVTWPGVYPLFHFNGRQVELPED